MEAITREIAEKEVNAWLAWKKVPQAYIDGSKLYINGMIIAVQEGSMIIDSETKEITHKLKWPIGSGEFAITELKYKPRLGVSVIQANIAGISMTDLTGRTLGIIAALCGKPRTEIAPMDSEDYRAASDVAAFFSP
jgi:hypothetical protein